MLSFKDLIANDIENVFENPGEFAEELEIVMGSNGRKHKVVGVIDTDTEAVRERKVHYVRKRTEDLGMGIAVCDARLFVKKGKLVTEPREGMVMKVNGEAYLVDSVSLEMGEYVIGLNRYSNG